MGLVVLCQIATIGDEGCGGSGGELRDAVASGGGGLLFTMSILKGKMISLAHRPILCRGEQNY